MFKNCRVEIADSSSYRSASCSCAPACAMWECISQRQLYKIP